MDTKVSANKLIWIAAIVAMTAFVGVWLMQSNVAAQTPEDNGIAATAIAAAETVASGPVSVGGDWQEISVSTGVGSFAQGCAPADSAASACVPSSAGNSVFATAPPWTFAGATILTVTDAFASSDQFEVYDNSVSIGVTSAPGAPGSSCGSDPVVCMADPNFSSGTFNLSSGSHSITIKLIAGLSAGAYYFRVDAMPVGGSTSFLAEESGSSAGLIAGYTAVAAIVVTLIAAGTWYTRRRRQGREA